MSDQPKPLDCWGVAVWGSLSLYAENSPLAARKAAEQVTGFKWEWLRKNAGFRVVRIRITAKEPQR